MVRAGTVGTLVGVAALVACAGQAAAAEIAAPGQVSSDAAVFPAQVAAPRLLDLRAPDITKLLTPAQIETILSQAYDRNNIEEIEVQGVRVRTGPIPLEGWSGAGAPLWALLRLIAPHPSYARYARNDPPRTSGYLPPAAAYADASLGWN